MGPVLSVTNTPFKNYSPYGNSALVDSIVLIDGLSWACGGICHTLDKDWTFEHLNILHSPYC